MTVVKAAPFISLEIKLGSSELLEVMSSDGTDNSHTQNMGIF